jgi:3'-5' exoribonuclease
VRGLFGDPIYMAERRIAPSGALSNLETMTNPAQMEALQAPIAAAPAAMPLVRTFVREFAEGDAVEGAFAVRERERRTKKNGEDYLRLIVADRTGSVEAVCWEEFEACFEDVAPGAVVYIEGRFSVHAQFGPKITVKAIRPARADEFEHEDLAEGPPVAVERLEADLRSLLETIQNPQLKALLDKVFAPDSGLWERFRVAPAAKYYHQAYVHGLLDHTLSVAQTVSAAAGAFPGIDRDVAITGALLHDIGKTLAYNDDPLAIDLTDAGRLQGEIPLGYYLVRRAIESIEGFDRELAQAVLHIVLSHHGKLENGSPVVPATREAALVHAMDNLGGTLGSFDRIERELPEGQAWSRFDRGIDSAAYFGSRAA